MGDILRLVEVGVSEETVQTLERRLAEAKKGDLIGVAFVAFYRGSQFTADVAGEARRAPVVARGILKELDEALGFISKKP